MRKTNFTVGVKVHDQCGYVARDKELDDFMRCLLGGGSALILGLPQVGKSAFLSNAWGKLSEVIGRDVKVVRLSGYGTDFSRTRSVAEQFREKLGDAVQEPSKLVVLLDEFNRLVDESRDRRPEEIGELWKVICAYLQVKVRFVLVAQWSPYDQERFLGLVKGTFPPRSCFTEIVIPPFRDDQLAQYCAFSRFPVSAEMRAAISSYTHGHAGLMSFLLRQLNNMYEDAFSDFFQEEIAARYPDLQELWQTKLRYAIFAGKGELVDELKERLPPGHAVRRKLAQVNHRAIDAVDFASGCAECQGNGTVCGHIEDMLGFYRAVTGANLTAARQKKVLMDYGVLDEEGCFCGAVREYENCQPVTVAGGGQIQHDAPTPCSAVHPKSSRLVLNVDLYKFTTQFYYGKEKKGAKTWKSPIQFLMLLLGCRKVTEGGIVAAKLNELIKHLEKLDLGASSLRMLHEHFKTVQSSDLTNPRRRVNEWTGKEADCCLLGKCLRGRGKEEVPPSRTFNVEWSYHGKPLFVGEKVDRLSLEAVPDEALRSALETFLKE